MSMPDFQECVLDHIAIAVKKISDAKKIYEDIGFVFSSETEEVVEQKVLTKFASIDEHAHIELLEPTSPESAVFKFIEQKGEGIHHICFRVMNIQKKMDELSGKGYRFIYPQAKLGAGGCMVNFIHPKSAGGVLIELSQKVVE